LESEQPVGGLLAAQKRMKVFVIVRIEKKYEEITKET
jgi:hypothetical protein